MARFMEYLYEGKKVGLKEAVDARWFSGQLDYIPPDAVNFDELLYRDAVDVCDVFGLLECIIMFQPWLSVDPKYNQPSWADIVLRVLYARHGEHNALQEFLSLFGDWNCPDVEFVENGILVRTYGYISYPSGNKRFEKGAWFLEISWATPDRFPSYSDELTEYGCIALQLYE